MRRIIAFSLVFVVLVTGCAFGASRRNRTPAKTYTARPLLQSPFLPAYTNPQEVDLKKSGIHISFKGCFRGADIVGNPSDWVYFAFAATPQNDMYLSVKQSELFDGKARVYKYHTVPDIGGERVFGREVIGGITVPVLVGVNMPVSEAGDFPSVSRITITFNGESFQFRNIVAEDWETWQKLRENLGI